MQTSWLTSLGKALAISAVVAAAATQALPASANLSGPPANAPRHSLVPFNGGTAKRAMQTPHQLSALSALSCGVQFSSWIAPNDTQYWFTYGWNPVSNVEWSVMDDTPWDNGSVSLSSVATDRNDTNDVTYHFVIQNLSANWKLFEARYCYLQ